MQSENNKLYTREDVEKASLNSLELIQKHIIEIPNKTGDGMVSQSESWNPLSKLLLDTLRSRKNPLREAVRKDFLEMHKEALQKKIDENEGIIITEYVDQIVFLNQKVTKNIIVDYIKQEKLFGNMYFAEKKQDSLHIFRLTEDGKEEEKVINYEDLELSDRNIIDRVCSEKIKKPILKNNNVINHILEKCEFATSSKKNKYTMKQVQDKLTKKAGTRKTTAFAIKEMSANFNPDQMNNNCLYLKVSDDKSQIVYACINEKGEKKQGEFEEWRLHKYVNYEKNLGSKNVECFEDIKKCKKFILGELTRMNVIFCGSKNTLFYEKKEEIENSAKNSLNSRTGNCDEIASLGFVFLMEQEDLKEKKIPIEIVNFSDSVDHVFVIAGRNPDSKLDQPHTWGNEAHILDGWMGEKGKCFNVYESLKILYRQTGQDNEEAIDKIGKAIEENLTVQVKNDLFNHCKLSANITPEALVLCLYSAKPNLKYVEHIGCGHTEHWNKKRDQYKQNRQLSKWEQPYQSSSFGNKWK